MKNIITLITLAAFLLCAACGGSPTANAPANKTNNNATENKSANSASSPVANTGTAPASSGASAVVKDIYENAIKRNCSAIPPLLTEDFSKSAGTSKDELDALCDVFSDSGKITAVEIKSETVTGDSAAVKVILTRKDGKKEDKEETVTKSGDKWLMDS
jgi:hypothetical protein